jgi:hypothetical protein
MIEKVPYWRPPPVGRISDFPADLYEEARKHDCFWGNGVYNPDYEYGTVEENCARKIPLPWPMTADQVAAYLKIFKQIMLIEAGLYPVGKRPDMILQTSERELIPKGPERDRIEAEFRRMRRNVVGFVCGIHGYEEYRWPGEFGVRFFLDAYRRGKLTIEFFLA